MKAISTPIFRAVIAIIIGCLLIKFGQDSLFMLIIAIPVLGAINQFVRLIMASHLAPVGLGYWLSPVAIMLTGLIAILRPDFIESDPLFIIGWMILVYGIVEGFVTFKVFRCRKIAEQKALAEEEKKEQEVSAEIPAPSDSSL